MIFRFIRAARNEIPIAGYKDAVEAASVGVVVAAELPSTVVVAGSGGASVMVIGEGRASSVDEAVEGAALPCPALWPLCSTIRRNLIARDADIADAKLVGIHRVRMDGAGVEVVDAV